MFTGLVTHQAEIIAKEQQRDGGAELFLANPFPASEPVKEGESIAVNGCCLTALEARSAHAKALLFYVSEETLSLTTLGSLPTGALVNLERALQAGDRLGGHVVSGHIDCRGVILKSVPASGSTCVTLGYPAEYGALVISKGSVTVDGVSLTINSLDDDRDAQAANHLRGFTVNIIPHTNDQTGFNKLIVGDSVNLEFDMFAKFALRQSHPDLAEAWQPNRQASAPATEEKYT